MKNKRLTRRDFLQRAAGWTLSGASLSLAWPWGRRARAQSLLPGPVKVVLVRDPEVLRSDGKPDADVLARMLDQAVAALLDESDAAAAWPRLISPDDIVGIKSNVWRFLPTPRELEDAIRERVMAVGVSQDRIAVDDRGVLWSPVFQKATALINVRPMRTHHWAGVGSCLKNYIMFSPDPPSWHGDSCANLAGLWNLPLVRGKTRLNVLVLLTPLFHGKGPHHFQARYTWEYKGLLVGIDPVAVDATGLRILEAKRRDVFGRHQPFSVPPKHIRIAEEKYHLGVADPSRIEVQKIGWTEGALI